MPVTIAGIRELPIADLTRYPGNPRRGNVTEIRASVRRLGQYRPIVVRDTGTQLVILAGNHTTGQQKAVDQAGGHPCPKPAAFWADLLENYSKRGATVLDVFGGSGTTLIAAHGTGRVARLMELDPAYCDVICRRYQEHTGVQPELVTAG